MEKDAAKLQISNGIPNGESKPTESAVDIEDVIEDGDMAQKQLDKIK